MREIEMCNEDMNDRSGTDQASLTSGVRMAPLCLVVLFGFLNNAQKVLDRVYCMG